MTESPTPPSGTYNPLWNQFTDPPIETITAPYDTGYEIGPNQIFIFPFALLAGCRSVFNVMHTARYREDFSLQCWFSSQPNVPVIFYSNHTYNYSIIRVNQGFCMQDIGYNTAADMPAPSIRTILAEPGNYYFNVQNRINALNKFEFVYQNVEIA